MRQHNMWLMNRQFLILFERHVVCVCVCVFVVMDVRHGMVSSSEGVQAPAT